MDNSFLSKLRLASIFGGGAGGMMPGPGAQSLFGDLIPRRIEEIPPEIVQNPVAQQMPRMAPIGPARQPGINAIGEIANQNQGQGRIRNVKFDDDRLEIEKARLDREKFYSDRDDKLTGRNLDERKFQRDLTNDRDKADLENRKLALDRWQAENKDGEIKTDENGRLMLIDKQTGKSIDTGLKSGDMSEEEKMNKGLLNQKDMESIRQRNRVAIEKIRREGRNKQAITPSQQRIANDDAAISLLNGKYNHLKDYITVDESGVRVDKPKAKSSWTDKGNKEVDNILFDIDAFEQDLKTEADKRLNMAFERDEIEDEEETKTIDMITPDGRTIKVPENEVEEAKAAGAKDVSNAKPTVVADDIELMYNDKGQVIGARNRKPFKPAK